MKWTTAWKAAMSCVRELSGVEAGATGAGAESGDFTQQEEIPQPQVVSAWQSCWTGDAKAGRCESTSARLKRMVTMAFIAMSV
jgi:hypothetical protein